LQQRRRVTRLVYRDELSAEKHLLGEDDQRLGGGALDRCSQQEGVSSRVHARPKFSLAGQNTNSISAGEGEEMSLTMMGATGGWVRLKPAG
jgi:hypothetical protein